MFIRNFLLYIKETSENICFCFMKKQVKIIVFISWLVSFEVVFRYKISVMWWEINSKQSISTRVNQKKIKSSRKKYVMWTWFKLWQVEKPMRVWLWLVCKFAENYCCLWHFSEFIQTQERYSTSLDKIGILIWKLLLISS